MKMKKHGSPSNPTILLLCAREPEDKQWKALIDALALQYHILIPQLMKTASTPKTLKEITHYVASRYDGHIYAVYGLADSWSLLHEMLREGRIHSSKTMIESCDCPPGCFAASLLSGRNGPEEGGEK